MTTWKDILVGIADWPMVTVTSVVKEFGVSKSHASIVLSRMRQWGYLRYLDRSGKGYGGYEVTEWGKKYAKHITAPGGEVDRSTEGT